MPGQQHQGRLGHQRGVERRDRVGVARAAGDQRDADFAGDARMGVGHVHCRGFVTRVDESDAGVEGGVEHRHDVIAREREDARDAGGLERVEQGVAATVRALGGGGHAGLAPISVRC